LLNAGKVLAGAELINVTLLVLHLSQLVVVLLPKLLRCFVLLLLPRLAPLPLLLELLLVAERLLSDRGLVASSSPACIYPSSHGDGSDPNDKRANLLPNAFSGVQVER
jgi:hypothetical protein